MKKSKAVVIGSGFGGLSLAIRLQAAGYETKILEKRDLPGGRAYCYKDEGFTFDAGPTVITAPQCLEELFQLAGKNIDDYVKLVPVAPFYRLLWDDGVQFDYSNEAGSLRRQIMDLSPEDWVGYQKFMEYSKSVFKAGYSELADVAFPNFWSMVKVAPQLVSLSAYRSVYSMVKKYIKEEHLRQAFSFHSLLVGGNPFASSSIYTLIHYLERNWGVYFPLGGTHALVRGLVRLFEELGGEIHYNSEVDEIVAENKKIKSVRTCSGDIFETDICVSNGDVAHTYGHLLRNNSDVRWTRFKTLKSKFSMSLFLIYFGVGKEYPDIAHHNVIFGPRYKELLKDIFTRGVLAEDFSLYLHHPTATDKSLAPKGCSSFYALSPVPHLGKADINWQEEGPRYAEKIISFLDEKHIPGLRENLVTKRIFTPDDFKTELNAHLGSAFSMEPLLHQSAYFRSQNRDKNIRGLYLVGAGTHPGAGIPGVVNSAKATGRQILEDFSGPTEMLHFKPESSIFPEASI